MARISKEQITEIIREEIDRLNEASMTSNFKKAIEAYQEIQLKQQQLQKTFVSEKNPNKREALKKKLIAISKLVKRAEAEFNRALQNEPIELDEKLVFYFDKAKDKIMRFDTDRSKNKKYKK